MNFFLQASKPFQESLALGSKTGASIRAKLSQWRYQRGPGFLINAIAARLIYINGVLRGSSSFFYRDWGAIKMLSVLA